MRSLTRRLGRNDGFTIIELLMAIMTGVVVTGALYAILEVSLHQTSRVTDTVQATQLGRIAMTDVVDELHSTCLARKFAPVQEKSTSKELIFINGTGEEALLSSSKSSSTRSTGPAPTLDPASCSTRATPPRVAAGRTLRSQARPRRRRSSPNTPTTPLNSEPPKPTKSRSSPTTNTPAKREPARAPPRRGRSRHSPPPPPA